MNFEFGESFDRPIDILGTIINQYVQVVDWYLGIYNSLAQLVVNCPCYQVRVHLGINLGLYVCRLILCVYIFLPVLYYLRLCTLPFFFLYSVV